MSECTHEERKEVSKGIPAFHDLKRRKRQLSQGFLCILDSDFSWCFVLFRAALGASSVISAWAFSCHFSLLESD